MCAEAAKPRRVLLVLDCGIESPSAMVRGVQYRPLFEQRQDIKVDYVSRRSEFMSRLLNQGHRPLAEFAIKVLRGPLERRNARLLRQQEDRIVEQASRYDVVYLLKVPSASLQARLCALGKPRVLMDLNDGLWLPFHHRFGWQDLDKMLAQSHGVVCENDYVAGYARRHNPRVFLVPDAPQVEVFDQWRAQVKRDPARVVLGWIGSAANANSLATIWEPLEELFARHANLHLRVVGADAGDLPRFEKVRWSNRPAYNQEEMVREVLAMDIGLFPQFKTEDSRARGTLKAMVYMSGEAAVLCQNYGENPKLINDGVNGLLADSPQEWREKLERLITRPQERQATARQGLQTIREKFTRQKCFEKLLQVLMTV